MIKFPHIEVQLTGNDGNAFAIIGAVTKALKRAGLAMEAKEFMDAACKSDSYNSLLVLAQNTVTVL